MTRFVAAGLGMAAIVGLSIAGIGRPPVSRKLHHGNSRRLTARLASSRSRFACWTPTP